MQEEIIELKEDLSSSPLYSKDLAPVPPAKRTWGKWDLAALWVGMAVCIPTYLLASYMIREGLSWHMSLLIIGVANLIITVPMVLNGHAGVKYGIPFPVLGRASFGINGIHIASIVRAIVACGWFGVQTWIGGLAFYAIYNAITGNVDEPGLNFGEFVGFGLFWLLNMYFIWKGTESIKWLEDFAAPILILIGLVLIGWGAYNSGGFGSVLKQGSQLENSTAVIKEQKGKLNLYLSPLKSENGAYKAAQYAFISNENKTPQWINLEGLTNPIKLPATYNNADIKSGNSSVQLQFKKDQYTSSVITAKVQTSGSTNYGNVIWGYLVWLTAMVGFWATMSLSIADITRFAATQKDQVSGQFIGLPGTMILYSFVGIFVTFAAIINFEDILIGDDAPWDPVSFLAKFDNPLVVVISQIFMIIATLSTNIAANVIAPANAFSNLLPKQLSFRGGGVVTAIIGIIICPWWVINDIGSILIDISALLGPVLGILLCDYYIINKKKLSLADLYKTNGIYSFEKGFNITAMLSFGVGVVVAITGKWVPALDSLYKLSWFSGFIVAFVLYYLLMKNHQRDV